jgi:predicted amidohydrolase
MLLRVAVVQFAPRFADPQRNLATILSLLDWAQPAHIVVLPELATTGYFFQSRDEVAVYAEPLDGPTLERLHREACWRGQLLILGFAERHGDRLYNSAALLLPEPNERRVYRKTHLFYKEKLCFDPGDTGFFVVHYPRWDVRIGTMICYDWRFPEAARTLALQGADLIACPANLVTDAWRMVMPVRALENKVYLALANRTGSEERNGEQLIFRGESAIYSYTGATLCRAGADDTTVLIVEIEPTHTRNKAFDPLDDIFADRRPEHYRL